MYKIKKLINSILYPIRKLYDWVLNLSKHRYAVWFLSLVSFTESSFFPIPPDVLLISMCLSKPKRSYYYATICTIFSVLGGLFGYLIGYFLFQSIGKIIIDFYNLHSAFDKLQLWYGKYDAWAVFIAGFTPIPFKLATLSSGVFKMSIPSFIIACIASRGLRFFIVATILRFFGEKSKELIDKYFGLLTFVFIALIILGFVVLF